MTFTGNFEDELRDVVLFVTEFAHKAMYGLTMELGSYSFIVFVLDGK